MSQSIIGLENVQPYKFSECSRSDYIDALRIGHGLCLLNKPNEVSEYENQNHLKPYLHSPDPRFSLKHKTKDFIIKFEFPLLIGNQNVWTVRISGYQKRLNETDILELS